MTSELQPEKSPTPFKSQPIQAFDVLMGAPPQVNFSAKTVTLSSCQIYMDGQFYPVPQATLNQVALTGKVHFAIVSSDLAPNIVAAKSQRDATSVMPLQSSNFSAEQSLYFTWQVINPEQTLTTQLCKPVYILQDGEWLDLPSSQAFVIDDYFTRFEPSAAYQEHLFRAGSPLQSAELNDIQKQSFRQTKAVADTLYENGHVLDGGKPHVTAEFLSVSPALIYLEGAVRALPEFRRPKPQAENYDLGVFLSYAVISEVDDVNLRDPAVHHANAAQAGAWRLQAQMSWGFANEAKPGQFYLVHRFFQGALVKRSQNSTKELVSQSLASYSKNVWGGDFVVSGLQVQIRPSTASHYCLSLTAGTAYVSGYEVGFEQALVHPVAKKHQTQLHVEVVSVAENSFTWTPKALHQVESMRWLCTEQTSAIAFNGGDAFDFQNKKVQQVLAVTAGDLTFEQGRDYKLENNQLIWLQKQQTSETYQIRYSHYQDDPRPNTERLQALADKAHQYQMTLVTDAVVTACEITYSQHRPRTDVLGIDLEGKLHYAYGHAERTDELPSLPSNTLMLACIYMEGEPVAVKPMAVQSMSMQVLNQMQEQIQHLYYLLAEERLARRVQKTGNQGLFVDSFYSNALRDHGAEQSFIHAHEDATVLHAEICDGVLQLPLHFADQDLYDLHVPWEDTRLEVEQTETGEPDYELVLAQPQHTSSMKVNPYAAFKPLPALVSLTPAIDQWTEKRPQIKHFDEQRVLVRTRSAGLVERVLGTDLSEDRSFSSQALETMRSRRVVFELSHWGTEEALVTVEFDGIDVTDSLEEIS
jgi:hypothetical protein